MEKGDSPGTKSPLKMTWGLTRSLWGVFFCDTVAAASTGLFIFVYSLYIFELGGNGIQVGIIYSVSLVVAVVSFIPGAYLIHKVDRKIIMITCMLVPAPALYLLYNAHSWIDVLVAEAIWFSNNYGAPAFITYITEASPKHLVMRRFGLIYAGPALASVVAPAAGFLIINEYGNIRDIFPFALVLRIIAPAFLFMIESQIPKKVVDKSQKLARRLFALKKKDYERIGYLVGISAVLSMCVPYLPLYLSEIRGFDDMQVQILGSIGFIGAAVLSVCLGDLGSRKGGTLAVLTTLIIFIAGCTALLGSDPIMSVLLAVFLLGIMTAVTTILDSIAGLKSGEENIGGQLSVYLLLETIAMAPMPVIGGLFYDNYGQEWPFIVGAVLAGILIVAGLLRKDITDTGAESSVRPST